MRIKVEKPSKEQIAEVRTWPTWEKEISSFEWSYEEPETCYLLDGNVQVIADDGETVEFGGGDLVTFAAGLKCRWIVRQAVRKHYRMG